MASNIAGIEKETLKDYPGKIAPVIYLSGCNFVCPTCHAGKIKDAQTNFDFSDLERLIEKYKKGFFDAVIICGGEPTVDKGLMDKLKLFSQNKVPIKIDTNGSNPVVLKQILDEKLVEYVAMDIKGPKNMYSKLIGRPIDTNVIEESMNLVQQFPDYEFRTTFVPFVDERLRFFNEGEFFSLMRWIVETTKSDKHKYYLQPFVSRAKEEMIDSSYGKENLPLEFQRTPEELLTKFESIAKGYLPRAKKR